jgi:hypothetical protein
MKLNNDSNKKSIKPLLIIIIFLLCALIFLPRINNAIPETYSNELLADLANTDMKKGPSSKLSKGQQAQRSRNENAPEKPLSTISSFTKVYDININRDYIPEFGSTGINSDLFRSYNIIGLTNIIFERTEINKIVKLFEELKDQQYIIILANILLNDITKIMMQVYEVSDFKQYHKIDNREHNKIMRLVDNYQMWVPLNLKYTFTV